MTMPERSLRPRERSRSERRQPLRSRWSDARWWVIVGLFLLALMLGVIGFRDYLRSVGGPTGALDVLYRALQLFILESGALSEGEAVPGTLQVARFLAPLAAIVFAHQALAPLFRERLQVLRLRRATGHVVVCGLGNRGLELARALRAGGYRVVAVEQAEAVPQIELCRAAGVPVLVGDATDATWLRRAGVTGAAGLVAVCGDDGVNAKIAAVAQRMERTVAGPLRCHIHIFEPQLCALLQARQPEATDLVPFRLEFFNTFERGAQALLLRHRPFPDDGPADPPPHLLVVGLGWLGSSLVVQAARNWFSIHRGEGAPLEVTVVDLEAAQRVESLLLRHPRLHSTCSIHVEDLDVRSPGFEQGAFLDRTTDVPITAAYVCLDDDPLCLEAALTLHAALGAKSTPIVMRALTSDGLPALLGVQQPDEFEALRAFPLIERVCDPDLLFGGVDEEVARALHDVYLQRREAEGWRYGARRDDTLKHSPVLVPWDELAEDLRRSNRDQAADTPQKLAALGCVLEGSDGWVVPRELDVDEVAELAEMEHERWVRDQLANGWTSGPADPDARRSPYLVPWGDLPEEIKEYDRDFVRRLPLILAKLGYRIVPVANGTSAP